MKVKKICYEQVKQCLHPWQLNYHLYHTAWHWLTTGLSSYSRHTFTYC